MSINLQTRNRQYTDSLSGWTNSGTKPFSTFTATGRAISSAIKDASDYAYCWTNNVYIIVPSGWRGALTLNFYITVNSGTCPYESYYEENVLMGNTDFGYTSPGWYNVGHIILSTGNYKVGFQSADGHPATNFTISDAHIWAEGTYFQI